MKYLLITTILFAFCGVALAAPTKTSEMYVIKFEASWCGPCKRITESFKNVGVKELIKTYGNRDEKGRADGKPYIVDIDKTDKSTLIMMKWYGKQLRMGGIPYVIIVNKKGKILKSIRGYRSANGLKKFLRKT